MTRHTKKIIPDIRATQDGGGASSQNATTILSVSGMNRYTKKSILIGVAFLAFALAPHVLADTTQGFTALAPITGLTDQAPTTGGLATFFNNLYKYLIGVAAIFAVIEIIWGGLEISTQDSVSKQSAGRERIQEAILGLVLVLSPVLVFSIINPSILNLSLNLPLIKASAPTSYNNGSGGSTASTTNDNASGCQVTGDASTAQIATCPTGDAATKWGSTCTGSLSQIFPVTKNADGSPAQSKIFCYKRNIFVFIDLHTSTFSTAIGNLQPLATASNIFVNGSNTLYETNGVDAVSLAGVCSAAGLKTCIQNSNTFNASYTCSPLPKSTLPTDAPSPATCYTEKVLCQDASFVSFNTCSNNPGWTPFQ